MFRSIYVHVHAYISFGVFCLDGFLGLGVLGYLWKVGYDTGSGICYFSSSFDFYYSIPGINIICIAS